MSLSARIAGHLPLLRRYARSVSGSQTSGDAYVAAMLESIIADISIFPKVSDDRVAIFKLFTQLFDAAEIEITPVTSAFAWEAKAAERLANVPSKARQTFLLISVEGFSVDEAAAILDREAEEVRMLLTDAAHEISAQVATEIMIIEDEPLIAMDIEDMVTDLGHSVSGIARTHKEAVELFARSNPKMVLADIQLADGSSGIDAVNDILKTANIPVIFITAFPERLLTGERPEPAFLVTKPFNPEMVQALISQALFFSDVGDASA